MKCVVGIKWGMWEHVYVAQKKSDFLIFMTGALQYENRSKGTSLTFRAMEQKCRRERHGHDKHEIQDYTHVALSRGERTISYIP